MDIEQRYPYFPFVEGWLNPNALKFTEYLVKQFVGENFSSLEIGVHHGKFFLGIENLTPSSGRCVAIDIFENQSLNIDGSGKGDKEIFAQHVTKWANAPERVSILSSDSIDLHPNALGINTFGIISIDGGHTRNHTFNDLRIAQELLTPNGIIVLDDINNQDWCGVVTGALDFFNSPISTRVRPIAIGFNKLYISHFSVSETVKNAIQKDSEVLHQFDISAFKSTPFGSHEILSLHPYLS
jgi:hypothetical protein